MSGARGEGRRRLGDGRGGGSRGRNPAQAFLSPTLVSLRTGSPAVPGVLGLKGEWGAQGEGRPPRGFAALRGQDRTEDSISPCSQGPRGDLATLLFFLSYVCCYVPHVNMGVVLISETRSFACGTEA